MTQKLTGREVRTIRKVHKENGLSYSQLARWYDVTVSTIYKIIKRITWKELDNEKDYNSGSPDESQNVGGVQ